MAKVVRFHETGGPEVLKIEELEVPPPGEGEVQIRIHALGLNRAESMFRRGQYLEEPKLPARLGYEAAGTVAAIGPGVQGFQVGDAVSTIPSFSLNAYGLYGDLANAPAHAVTHHPASLSWVEAAAVWMQYLTAYGALIDIAGLTKGDAIVIPAASSSVGLAAIQIANKVGAVPIALTRGSSKRQALLDAGAAHVIATDEQDLVKEIRGLTGGKGARVVFDPVGGPTFTKLVQATARLGIAVPLRRPEPRADAAAAVRRPGQVAHDPRLRADGDHQRSETPGTRQDSSSTTGSPTAASSRSSPGRSRSRRSSRPTATWSRTSRSARSS